MGGLLRKVQLGRALIPLLLLLQGSGWAQDDWHYPPQPEFASELNEIRELVELGDFRAAKARYLQLSACNPQTSVAGKALYSAAMVAAGPLNDKSEAAALLRTLIEQYPGSRFEIAAKRVLVSYQLGSDATYNDGTEALAELAHSLGGPPLSEIISGTESVAMDLAGSNPEFRLALADLYLEVFYGLVHYGREQEAVDLARFGRASFDRELTQETFRECLEYAVSTVTGLETSNLSPGLPNSQPYVLSQ